MHGIGHVELAESIDMPFGVVSGLGSRDRAIDRLARWRHLANTIERLCSAAVSASATSGSSSVCS